MSEIKQGYKQTKVGIIPEDWDVVKVGEVCDCIVPGRNKPENFDGDIPWVTTPDIMGKYISDTKSQLYISAEEAKKVGSKIIPKNSVIMSCVGELGLLSIVKNEIVINQQLHAFLPSSKIQTEFLHYALNTQKKYMDSVATKTAVPYMNKDNCNSIPVPLPPLKEQEKIAEILTTWDEAITKQTELLEAKELQKKALMQKLLSGEVRFSGFSDEWHFYKLGYLLDYEQPTNYLVNDTNYDDSFNTPVLTAGKTFILGYTNETDGIYKEQLPVIIFDDFTTATQFVNFPFKAKSSAMKILKSKGNLGNIKVIFELMQTIKYQADDHKRYWISEYQDLEIKLPSLPEQQKIAEVLSLADDEINLLKNELEELKLQKKALMQKLLTGQVRVKV